jgi:NhaA family Na+:H+ antiporter
LAILDDIGAIIIIALFYTSELKVDFLFLALIPLAGLIWLNIKGAHRIAPAILLGVVMWFFVLKSGVHATLAGVITALCIPLVDRWGKSPLHSLEHALTPYVLYLIIPIFAFANAGVVLTGIQFSDLFAPVPLGIAAGLTLGKQIGVFGVTWIMVKLGIAQMPHGAGWSHIYGVACLAGIGFTMSLFIGGLSFSDPDLMNAVRLGVLSGSLVSGVIGYVVLMLAPAAEAEAES